MHSLLGRIRLTFAIAALAVCSIVISVGAVTRGLFISLSGTVREEADAAVASATRISASILQVNLPSLEVISDEAGNVAALTMRSMPRFRTHDVIDTIARVAGQDATIYVHDPEAGPDMTVGTTSLLDEAGERLLDMPIPAGTALFDSLVANQPVRGEATIAGVDYYTLHQPIAMADGQVIGVLAIAVEKAPINAVMGETLAMLAGVGAIALLTVGAVALLLSRVLTRPIPRLSATMSAIADGRLGEAVPYTDNRNEIGAMARAVEVFRANAERVAELGAETQRHLSEAADHTGQLDAISRSQLVAEFTLTGELLTANDNFLDFLGYRLEDVEGLANAHFLFDADPTSAAYGSSGSIWLQASSRAANTNARRARDAAGKAAAVSDTAGQSGTVMAEATEAMERISESSAKISNIIGLIDDIAFRRDDPAQRCPGGRNQCRHRPDRGTGPLAGRHRGRIPAGGEGDAGKLRAA